MAHCALWLTLIALGILTGVNYSITIVLGTMVQLTFERSGSVVLQCIHCFAYELCMRAYVCAFVWVRTCGFADNVNMDFLFNINAGAIDPRGECRSPTSPRD